MRPLLALLLPALLLRALLPAGFMLEMHGQQLRMVLCSTGLAALADDGTGGGDAPATDARDCPFAQAGGGAPPPSKIVSAPAALPVLRLQPAIEAIRASSGPPRENPARAPPFFPGATA